ncbi:MAG: HDIG domain-containing protein [Gemmatimonadaceae bacterium]|nr:HDIG domain-containing protein [Gemmatimonadaceae bacterium]
MTPTRDTAWQLVTDWTQSESLRKHMLTVEAAMRAYAVHYGEDPERWGLAGLIHDFDYERYPNPDRRADAEHPAEGVRFLRAAGWPDDVCDAVMGHAEYTGVPRTTLMAKCLFAVDELSGLVTATALVKPSKSVFDVDAANVRKKMKDKGFARGVSREDVLKGADELGVDLDQHIAFVVAALQRAAPELGLAGTTSTPPEGGTLQG